MAKILNFQSIKRMKLARREQVATLLSSSYTLALHRYALRAKTARAGAPAIIVGLQCNEDL